MSALTISDRAAAEIQKGLTAENPDAFLRLEVLGGGCSGFQYRFRFETDSRTDDHVFTHANGIGVHIDPESLELLTGSVIDYKEDMMGSAYVVTNPNADVSCGCGNSFSI